MPWSRTKVLPAAVATVLLAAVVVPVLAAGRAEQAPPSLAVAPVPVIAPVVPAPAASDPLVPPPGVDWAADAAIRAAVVDQQAQDLRDKDVARLRRQAQRRAARYVPPPTSTTTVPAPPAASSADVWVVGDSIAEGVGAAWPGNPYVLAEPGQRSATVVPQLLTALASGGPRVLVVALGTNDSSLEAAGFRARVAQVVAAAPHCVVWVTIHRPGTAWDPFNAALRDLAGGRLRLADWDAYADTHPDAVQSDGIHPRTGSVYATIAGLASAAARGC